MLYEATHSCQKNAVALDWRNGKSVPSPVQMWRQTWNSAYIVFALS